MIRRGSVVVVAAAFCLTACSSGGAGHRSSTPQATSAPPASTPSAVASTTVAPVVADVDPCGLVTKAEADMITGTTLMPADRAQMRCAYATPTTGPTGQLEIYVGDGAKKSLDIDKDTLGHDFTKVAGLGDEAYLEKGAIFVRSGATWLAILVLRLDNVDTGPSLKRLAATAVGRLT